MAVLGGILIVAVLLFACWKAVTGIGTYTAGKYRDRKAAWAAENPDAGGLHHAAATVGQLVGALRYGPGAIRHGVPAGFRAGMERGKRWAAAYKPEPPPAADDSEPPPPPAGLPPVPDRYTPPTPPTPAPPRRGLHAVPDPNPSPAPPATTNRSTPVPVIETTSGEIATPEQYRAEMAATVKEAAAEKEDATQDEARCVAELQRINRIIAAAKSDRIRLPQEELARLTQLAEATMRQKTNAQARIAAASARLAIAMQCEQDASRHLALVGQAAGTWYNPGASA